MRKTKIFAISSYSYMLTKLLKETYIGIGSSNRITYESHPIKVTTFPDGEVYHRIMTSVEDTDVVLIGGTVDDYSTLELYDLACAMVQNGAYSLTLIVPFMGYSTMERAVKNGEVVKAKTRAMLLSSIPSSPNGNKVILLDLHTEGLPHYFEKNIRTVHVYAKEIVMHAVKEIQGREVVLASTDAGRAKWVESLANDIGINAAFIFKRRVSGDETHVTSISADVKGKDVVIYDDMIRTGGSIVGAAQAYKDAGAEDIYVITTHGLFTNGGLDKIKNSGLVKYVVCTDSHPEAIKINDPFLKVKSIAGLISHTIGH